MSRAEPGGIDDRLRQLLDVERRLQDLVRAADEQAASRVALARANGERLRADFEARQAREAEAQDAADRAAHEQALLAVAAEAQSAVRSLSSVPDDRIEALARRALDRVMAAGRGTP